MCKTCKVNAVRKIDKARQPVSRSPKSSVICMPIVQATSTHRGTWSSFIYNVLEWTHLMICNMFVLFNIIESLDLSVIFSYHKHQDLRCWTHSDTQWYVLHEWLWQSYKSQKVNSTVQSENDYVIYQFVLEGEYNRSSMFCCVTNNW